MRRSRSRAVGRQSARNGPRPYRRHAGPPKRNPAPCQQQRCLSTGRLPRCRESLRAAQHPAGRRSGAAAGWCGQGKPVSLPQLSVASWRSVAGYRRRAASAYGARSWSRSVSATDAHMTSAPRLPCTSPAQDAKDCGSPDLKACAAVGAVGAAVAYCPWPITVRNDRRARECPFVHRSPRGSGMPHSGRLGRARTGDRSGGLVIGSRRGDSAGESAKVSNGCGLCPACE
jgi:hypothetical protein